MNNYNNISNNSNDFIFIGDTSSFNKTSFLQPSLNTTTTTTNSKLIINNSNSHNNSNSFKNGNSNNSKIKIPKYNDSLEIELLNDHIKYLENEIRNNEIKQKEIEIKNQIQINKLINQVQYYKDELKEKEDIEALSKELIENLNYKINDMELENKELKCKVEKYELLVKEIQSTSSALVSELELKYSQLEFNSKKLLDEHFEISELKLNELKIKLKQCEIKELEQLYLNSKLNSNIQELNNSINVLGYENNQLLFENNQLQVQLSQLKNNVNDLLNLNGSVNDYIKFSKKEFKRLEDEKKKDIIELGDKFLQRDFKFICIIKLLQIISTDIKFYNQFIQQHQQKQHNNNNNNHNNNNNQQDRNIKSDKERWNLINKITQSNNPFQLFDINNNILDKKLVNQKFRQYALLLHTDKTGYLNNNNNNRISDDAIEAFKKLSNFRDILINNINK